MEIEVREASLQDQPSIMSVIAAAFGKQDAEELTGLVSRLLVDVSAHPLWSLVATKGESVIGHVLFTSTRLEPRQADDSSAIMAPLAVDPKCQKQGVGGLLIRRGLNRLRDEGVRLVFVLGDPAYYSRHGFAAAGIRGFDAPYPVPEKHAEAWMVQELQTGSRDRFSGVVRCAKALDHVKYWVE